MRTTKEISPCVDIAFKRIFGVEANNELLKSFINSVVSDVDRVTEVTLLDPHNLRNSEKGRLSILDIKARSKSGEYFNIEVQVSGAKSYDKRALYYWAKLYTDPRRGKEEKERKGRNLNVRLLVFIFLTLTLWMN